jgi:hypothetical protein
MAPLVTVTAQQTNGRRAGATVMDKRQPEMTESTRISALRPSGRIIAATATHEAGASRTRHASAQSGNGPWG